MKRLPVQAMVLFCDATTSEIGSEYALPPKAREIQTLLLRLFLLQATLHLRPAVLVQVLEEALRLLLLREKRFSLIAPLS